LGRYVRVQAFTMLYSRVADRKKMTSAGNCTIPGCFCECPGPTDGFLYNLYYFERADVKEIISRVGILNVFDIYHACQNVPSNLGQEFNHPSYGLTFIQNRGNYNLTYPDERRTMFMLISLAKYEDGENLVDVTYSESKLDRGLGRTNDYLIPATWLEESEVPRIGTIGLTYSVDIFANILPRARKDLGFEFLTHKECIADV